MLIVDILASTEAFLETVSNRCSPLSFGANRLS